MTEGRADVSGYPVIDVSADAARVEHPHGATLLVGADGFMIHAWIGNGRMPDWHRNIDVDELWIHAEGPPITIMSRQFGDSTAVLEHGQLILLPQGIIHSADAPPEPRLTIVIVETTLHGYTRPSVAAALATEALEAKPSVVDLNEEATRFTPPWRYPQVEVVSADGFTVELHVRSEGSILRRGCDQARDHVWYVLQGEVLFEGDEEGQGVILGGQQMVNMTAGTAYRPVSVSQCSVALLFRRKVHK